MNLICTHLRHEPQAVSSVCLLKIDGCPLFNWEDTKYVAYRWEVDGYEWEIRFYPTLLRADHCHFDMSVDLVFLREARGNKVTAILSVRLVDPTGVLQPSAEKTSLPKSFEHPSDSSGKLPIMTRFDAHSFGYLKNGSVAVECTVTVFRAQDTIHMPSSSDLHKDLGEILRSEAGADVTFIVSGESLAAHRILLAARYGIDRLKVMCERRLTLGVDAGTVATMLALAEQHGCSQLKAKCLEFIVGASPEILGSVLATEGFKSLEASLLTELFMAAHGRIKK
ncbi:hypothetical protein EJB05_01522, partial [Eragrostis curvula]